MWNWNDICGVGLSACACVSVKGILVCLLFLSAQARHAGPCSHEARENGPEGRV